MLYMIWLIVGTCPKRCSNPTRSNRSAAANEAWSYTYEVGILRSSEGCSACLTELRPVCRCTSKHQTDDEWILTLTSHDVLDHSILGLISWQQVQQKCIHPDCVLRLGHAGCSDRLEPEVRSGSTSDMGRASSVMGL